MTDANGSLQVLQRELSESIFLLKKSSSTSTATVQVDFLPLVRSGTALQKEVQGSWPVFNADGCFCTPSFMLAQDRDQYGENRQLYQRVHYRKAAEISEQKSILLVPRPSKNNSFCCVCKLPFDDYLLHLATPKHQVLTRKSDYNRNIADLCQLFRKTQVQGNVEAKRKRGRPAKTKPIKKEEKQVKQLSQTKGSDEGKYSSFTNGGLQISIN